MSGVMKPKRNVGIIGYGAYVPRYRIKAHEIARVWGGAEETLPIDEKAVPGLDEDTVTMSIKAARNAVRGPFSFMKGKLPRYLTLDEHRELGVNIAWLPGFTHHVLWAALWDFMNDFQSRGIAAWDDFQAARRDRPYPEPTVGDDGEGAAMPGRVPGGCAESTASALKRRGTACSTRRTSPLHCGGWSANRSRSEVPPALLR